MHTHPMMSPPRTRSSILLNLALSVATTIVLVAAIFTTLELHPALIPHLNLEQVNYFAQRYRYVPHPTLVMQPRITGSTNALPFLGDLWVPGAPINKSNIYVTSYSSDGFRPDSAHAPFDAMLLGDSFVEFGENNATTLSELLSRSHHVRSANLGRHWYGPEQYNLLFQMHVDSMKPTTAVYCVFMGNDLEDISAYERWKAGEEFYHFRLDRRNFLRRAKIALWDVRWYLKQRLLKPEPDIDTLMEDVATIVVSNEAFSMRFAYWPDLRDVEVLLKQEEWLRFRTLLRDFRNRCTEKAIQPMVMLIPAKSSLYLPSATQAGTKATKYLNVEPQRLLHTHDAARSICADLDLPLLDLAVTFTQHAKEELLYYPWDTHWTLTGRELAAQSLADFLQDLQDSSTTLPIKRNAPD